MPELSALSKYELRARLAPGMLALLPVGVVVLAFGLKSDPVIAGLSSLLVTFGGPFALVAVVGNLGRSVEPALWKRWGGPPTAQVLRGHGGTESDSQRTAWRAAITSVTGVRLLPEEDEVAQPVLAEEQIATAVSSIVYLGYGDREDHDPAVVAENAAYGFERNLYACRWVGRLICLGCLVGTVAAGAIQQRLATLDVGISVALLVLIAIGWWLVPSAERTKAAGLRYARKLMQAVTHLAAGRTP